MNKPLDIPEFSERNYATLEDYTDDVSWMEEATVKRLPGPASHPVFKPAEYRTPDGRTTDEDDQARLHTPDNHRRKAVEETLRRLTQARLEAVSARGWLAAIGYSTDVRDAIQEAIDCLTHTQDLLEIHEGQK